MIVETERILVAGDSFLVERMATAAQRESFADKVEHHLCRLRIGIWPVIACRETSLTRHEHTRIQFVGDDNPWIRFVILKQNVVMRLILLDHCVFKVERILLGRHHNKPHVDNIAHEEICSDRIMPTVEITRHAAFQSFRLAYIDHLAMPVDIHIHTRRIGQVQDFLAQLGTGTIAGYVIACPVGSDLNSDTSLLVDIAPYSGQVHTRLKVSLTAGRVR